MLNDDQNTQSAQLFVGCFESFNQDTEELGTFQIAVLSQGPAEAVQKFRARFDEIADGLDNMGPIVMDLLGLVEVGRDGLAKGTLFHWVSMGDDGKWSHTPLPKQGLHASSARAVEDALNAIAPGAPDEKRSGRAQPFWSGIDDFRNKWKLYWCQTEAHNEDWFVVALDEYDAMELHEQAEGYIGVGASAEFVCILPPLEQRLYKSTRCPEDETLLACGAEFLPLVNRDALVGSDSRAVRLKGKIFVEGNTMRRLEVREES